MKSLMLALVAILAIISLPIIQYMAFNEQLIARLREKIDGVTSRSAEAAAQIRVWQAEISRLENEIADMARRIRNAQN
jgi:peptidoglycan hydrolase CwlO-like protein